MNGPRLTEERLRYHLDTNQPMRERMCLAILPLLGPYTSEQPRRPKGGPDGGRDIEALYQGQIPVWGAVGFKNGGGSDEATRDEIEVKFKSDLTRALEENTSLRGFVFFTNVDLTPSRKEALIRYAHSKNITHVEIFDIERIRHILDSPEGLIARLQYLDISMSPTEQAVLVGKFGNQLQQAVTARFDRVERTLAQMERFLSFQKPILRVDVYIELSEQTTSSVLGEEAVLLRIGGFHGFDKSTCFLCVNQKEHPKANTTLLTLSHIWNEKTPSSILTMRLPSFLQGNMMVSYNELSFTNFGNQIRIADLTVIHVEAICTEGIRNKIQRIAIDANGYELLNHQPEGNQEIANFPWPEKLAYDALSKKWVTLLLLKDRNLLFNPPNPSGRFHPLKDLPSEAS